MSEQTTGYETGTGWDETGEEYESPLSTPVYFDGDTGTLEHTVRNALVVLLKNKFVSAFDHRAEYDTIVEAQKTIRSRLADMWLELVIESEYQVAYKKQAVANEGRRFPTLLHATTWNREQTIAMAHLRRRVHTAKLSGASRFPVDREDLTRFLISNKPEKDNDRNRWDVRADRAVESLVSAGLLLGRKDAERFLISPVVEALLPLATLQHLLSWMRDPDGTAARQTDESLDPSDIGDDLTETPIAEPATGDTTNGDDL